MDYSIIQVLLIFIVTFIVAIDQFSFLESLYQPIVTGVVVGFILGDVQTGLVVGGTYQLMTIGNMPVGGAQPPNAVIGGIMAAVLAITLKLEPTAAVATAIPFSLLGQYGVTLIFSLMSPVMTVADKYAHEADTKGIDKINYLSMIALGSIFGVIVTLFFIGGATFGETVVNMIPEWLMGGLSAAGGMMRYVGFAILMKVMLSKDLWGFLFAGFAMATIVMASASLAGPALIILAFIGFAIAYWDFQIQTKFKSNAVKLTKEEKKMAYNIPDTYKDQTPAEMLDNKTLNKMVWRSLFLQASFNYERMQAGGWLYSILPGLKKIHKDKDDLAASMSHNLEFFNTHPFLVNFVMGIVLSLEQNKADIPTIRAVRVAAMGPLGGIGDALFWFTLVPITAGITANMAINENIAAPFIFLLIFNAAQFALRFFLMRWSYKMGTNAIGILTENAKEFTRAASILGIFIVGSLISVYGATSINVNIPNGTTNEVRQVTTIVGSEADISKYEDSLYTVGEDGKLTEEFQDGASVTELSSGDYEVVFNQNQEKDVTINLQEILNGILPQIIPLAITIMLYFFLVRRGWTPLKCIGLVFIIGLIGSGFGLWPSIWP